VERSSLKPEITSNQFLNEEFLNRYIPFLSGRKAKAHLRLGVAGERIARIFLRFKGFRILETNYKSKYGEIDIIAREKNTITFVEVKTRKSEGFGEPEEAVNLRKRRKLILCARYYIRRKRLEGYNFRFDIVSIKYLGRFRKKIKLIRDAFRI
jgi:putative endonuclease